MKIFREARIILLTTTALLITVFVAGRFGWKLLGFSACEGAGIESIEVGEFTVKIKGFYPGSFPEGFCGYYAEEQDGTLYVGFRFSTVFGFFETGDFDVAIPVKGEIREVVLKTEISETTIWTSETGVISSDIPFEVDAPAESDEFGVYVKLERSNVSSIAIHDRCAAGAAYRQPFSEE